MNHIPTEDERRYAASKAWLAEESRVTDAKIAAANERKEMAELQADPEIREVMELIDETPMTAEQQEQEKLLAEGELAHLTEYKRHLGDLAVQLDAYAESQATQEHED
jgi:hypothetical protein